MSETVIARGGDNILDGSSVSSTVAPSASYALTTLLTMQPAARVRFGAVGMTITFTLDAPARGDIFALPVSNLDPSVAGSSPASVLTLTNNNGLSVPVPIAALQANGLPNTTVIDLVEAEPNASTRTSDVWNLVIAGNSVDVILGGAVCLFGPKRTLDPDLRWGFSLRKQHGQVSHQNEYLTRYVVNLRTAERSVIASLRTNELANVEAWFDEFGGGAAPGLLWPKAVTGLDSWPLDAYVGILEPTLEAENVEGTDSFDVSWVFRELSKGKPL